MIKKIESPDNIIIKECIKLQSKKYRDKEGLYIIEGPNLVEEALKNNAKIKSILVMEGYDFQCPKEDVDLYYLGNRLFTKVASTQTPQGIMAIVEKQQTTIQQIMELDKQGGGNGNILILDKLQDPGNVGTMIRTADAAGYMAIILVKGSADVYSPKVVRSATGSLFRIPIMYVDSYDQLEEDMNLLSKELVATGFDTDKYYYEVDLSQGVGLIIGNEGNGVDPQLMAKANTIVKIPMEGNIESLNAAVAAGILMYQRIRNI